VLYIADGMFCCISRLISWEAYVSNFEAACKLKVKVLSLQPRVEQCLLFGYMSAQIVPCNLQEDSTYFDHASIQICRSNCVNLFLSTSYNIEHIPGLAERK